MKDDTEDFSRRNRFPSQNLGLGKLPPQAVEIESSVLGVLMLERDSLSEVVDIISAQSFYEPRNQKIYEAIIGLYNNSNPIDLLTVSAQLRAQGDLEMIGGSYYLTELTNRVATGANVEYWARIIQQKFIQREMIRLSTNTINNAYEDTTDIFDLMEANQREVLNLMLDTNKQEADTMGSLMFDMMIDLESPPPDGLTGVGTGFTDLDSLTGGWQPSDLIIIAARPAMGKTAFVLKCARNAAVKHKKPVVIFSLEMGKMQLAHRMVSSETKVYHDDIRKKKVSESQIKTIQEKSNDLAAAPIFIDDTPALNIFEFRAKCRRLKQKHDIQMIIVDYLQLMTDDPKNIRSNRDQQLGSITRTLKAVAKELDVPVIALSQLSRAVESRSDKRPGLADLRESGNIEQDADVVAFLYRPEYYKIMEQNGKPTEGLCEVIFGKHRGGTCETVNLDFNGAFMDFNNWLSGEDLLKASTVVMPSTNQLELLVPGKEDDEDLPF